MHNDAIAHQNDHSSKITPRLDKGVCLHWDSFNHTCLQVKDGLFLPIEQHVATYCQSSSYPFCPHYQLLNGTEDKVGPHDTPQVNRRRSNRRPCRHIFRFSEITDGDQALRVREDDAWTIDLSEHGIRLATRQLLSTETALRFLLEVDDTATKIEGTGRVIWSKPLEKTTLFHAGIDFTDRIVSSLPPHLP